MSSNLGIDGPPQVSPSGKTPADPRPRGFRRSRPTRKGPSIDREDPLQGEDRVSLSGRGPGLNENPESQEQLAGSGHLIDVTV